MAIYSEPTRLEGFEKTDKKDHFKVIVKNAIVVDGLTLNFQYSGIMHKPYFGDAVSMPKLTLDDELNNTKEVLKHLRSLIDGKTPEPSALCDVIDTAEKSKEILKLFQKNKPNFMSFGM